MRLVVDIETNALHNPDKLWCVVCKDIDTGTIREWTYETGYLGLEAYLLSAECVIGHNFINFDTCQLARLCGIRIEDGKITDTLVLSRLFNYAIPNGHGLEAWGERLKHVKTGLDISFSHYSPAILERCRNDVELNHKVYNWLDKKLNHNENGDFSDAISVEHRMACICRDMGSDGFGFDIDTARAIRADVEERLQEIDDEICKAFPPKAKLIREVTPRLTKHGTIAKTGISNWYEGTDYSIFSADSPFSLVSFEPFNPGSIKQIIERLNEAGWNPVDKTEGHKMVLQGFRKKGHAIRGMGLGDTTIIKSKSEQAAQKAKMAVQGWKLNEVNLATLPEDAPPAARLLVKRWLLAARHRTLKEWMSFYVEEKQAVCGQFNHIGTVTHRMSHNRPNLGNVASKKTIKYNTPELRDLAIKLGGQMRSLWRARDGRLLVGTDMEAAHLRIFAHLIDDPEFTQSLISGRKEDGTDPHSLNKKKLGELCPDRDRAKTFIFSFLNGAAAPKVSQIFDCSLQDAKRALEEFGAAYPGLQYLKSTVMPRDAARGYFKGLDGRLVKCAEERLLIGAYLQNAEAVIMKHANIRWRDELRDRGIGYKQVNFVHDEFVTEVRDDEGVAHLVGKVQSDSIKSTGECFKLRCPLAGEYKVGKDWLEVH